MNIKEWSKNDKDLAEHRNEAVRAVNNNLPILGGDGINATVNVGGRGTAVSIDRTARGHAALLVGKIVDHGADSALDFSDYRYHVQLVSNRITSTTHVDDGELDLHVIAESAYNASVGSIVTAYNASEFTSGTHSIPGDTYVYLAPIAIDEPESGQSVVPRTRWFILSSNSSDPTGEFQHQSLYMVSNDQRGWSFIRFHGLP